MAIEELLTNPVIQYAAIGFARGMLGWAENAVVDDKITFPEIQLLLATIIRVGFEAFSLAALGIAPEGAIALDMGLYAIKKKAAQATPV